MYYKRYQLNLYCGTTVVGYNVWTRIINRQNVAQRYITYRIFFFIDVQYTSSRTVMVKVEDQQVQNGTDTIKTFNWKVYDDDLDTTGDGIALIVAKTPLNDRVSCLYRGTWR
jgi:hypothetical protein